MFSSLTFISSFSLLRSYSTARPPDSILSTLSPALKFFSITVPEMGAVTV